MTFVFFFYGLSFVVLGLAIFVYPKRGSMFKLARYLPLVAAFGLIHGTNEWVDMFMKIGESHPELLGTSESIFLFTAEQWGFVFRVSRMVFLPVSFWFLVLFGTKVIIESDKKYSPLKVLPILLPAVWVAVFALSEDRFLMGDIWSRYLLCIPGTALTSYGLAIHLPQFEKTQLPVVIRHLKLAGAVFFVYGILAGAIVKKAGFLPASVLNYDMIQGTFGMPVQVLRAICASLLAYSTFRILSVFRWETANTLRESELRFRTIATSVPVILFVEDCDGKITFLEGKGLDALGIKSSELIGKPISSLFADIRPAGLEGCSVNPDVTYNSHINVKDKVFDVCYSPVQNIREQITGFIGVALDITQYQRAQVELEKNQQEMIKTKHLTELGTISTAMSREIERPLKITQLLLERLLKDVGGSPNPEQVAKTLEKSFSEVNEAVSVLTRFCDFARMSPAVGGKAIDLQKFSERVTGVCASSAERVNLKLVMEGVDVVPCISIAETELEYIFLVLIQNAIDSANSIKSEQLTISCEISEKHLRLTFADTCKAIPSEQLKNVFQPFFTAQPGGKESEFSLAIVNHIVNTCGGAINVESVGGVGTTFYLTLPVEQIH